MSNFFVIIHTIVKVGAIGCRSLRIVVDHRGGVALVEREYRLADCVQPGVRKLACAPKSGVRFRSGGTFSGRIDGPRWWNHRAAAGRLPITGETCSQRQEE